MWRHLWEKQTVGTMSLTLLAERRGQRGNTIRDKGEQNYADDFEDDHKNLRHDVVKKVDPEEEF